VAENRPERYAKDITIRYPINIPFSGTALRLTFDNYCGTETVVLNKVTVFYGGRCYRLTLNGEREMAISAGNRIVTDPLRMKIKAGEIIQVSFYLEDFTLMRSVVYAQGPLSEGLYANGDHTVTLIRTERGKQIEIQHNVVTRRPYDRKYQVTGTDGFACKYPKAGLAFKSENLKEESVDYEDLDGEKFLSDQLYNELMEKYSHPLLKGTEEMARKVGGHGGMDYIMDYRLIYCLRNGLPLDMDVYDAAEWSCLTELSGLSISYGSMPVEVPDFTRGDWQKIDGFSHAVK
jgi:hypothetical protein